ncbi:hypothetical protein CLOM_g12952 [Closterium sp. NIES-68]|nr:hypothetical protein CLOM_g23315 [Closterium sp. NIES-68]GJP53818.1 hypothetical protein CLOM_g12952 [Closterium sp. NIES-68]GJP61144.1 hypothetical protein CLOP_g18344 [Closterium sp. NIES-67]
MADRDDIRLWLDAEELEHREVTGNSAIRRNEAGDDDSESDPFRDGGSTGRGVGVARSSEREEAAGSERASAREGDQREGARTEGERGEAAGEGTERGETERGETERGETERGETERGETEREAVERRMAAATVIIAEETARSAGLTVHDDVMQALVHLTLTYAEQLARDLQLFARHAKRKRVEPDDVILSVHRNQALMKKLQALAMALGEESKGAKGVKSTKKHG